jgi:hypothetical protein
VRELDGRLIRSGVPSPLPGFDPGVHVASGAEYQPLSRSVVAPSRSEACRDGTSRKHPQPLGFLSRNYH